METEDKLAILGMINGSIPADIINTYKDLLGEIDLLNSKIDSQLTTNELQRSTNNKGLSNSISNSIEEVDINHKLYQDMGYFIYWLIHHFDYLVDDGFQTPVGTEIVLVPLWARRLIIDGYYNDIDKDFLNHITKWMNNRKWVYSKPTIDMDSELYDKIMALPTSITYNR